MQVSCPGCNSRFLLPEGVTDGTLLRCSVCQREFYYGHPDEPVEPHEPAAPEEPGIPSPKIGGTPAGDASPLPEGRSPAPLPELAPRRSHAGAVILVLLLVLAAGAFAAWQAVPEFREGVLSLYGRFVPSAAPEQRTARPETAAPAAPEAASGPVSGDSGGEPLVLRNVTQSYVKNDKTGRILVLEGSVVNRSRERLRDVHVEATLFDRERRALESKVQKIGVQLSSVQLSIMTEGEMLAALSDENEIALTNSDVAPGSEVPFTFVFFNPSADVGEYLLRVRSSERVAPPAPVPAPAQGR